MTRLLAVILHPILFLKGIKYHQDPFKFVWDHPHTLKTRSYYTGLNVGNYIAYTLPRTWYLVDMEDNYVVYIGTFKKCDQVIETLPGGTYVHMRRHELTPEMVDSIQVLMYHKNKSTK